MKKILISMTLALMLFCVSVGSAFASVDFSAFDPERKGIMTYEQFEEIVATTPNAEKADATCPTEICKHNGVEYMSFSRVHNSYHEEKGDGENTFDCILGGKGVVLKDIEKMSVFYSDMEQIVDGRPQGYYVAPDGFDESYSKQFIENIPAGTTFTFDKYGHYFIQIYYSGKSNDCINIAARLHDEEFDSHILASRYHEYLATRYEEYLNGTLTDDKKPDAPASSGPIMTTSKSQEVMIDGLAGPLEAYNIKDNNYFKLRDICSALSFVGYNIDVTWDGKKQAINLITGQPYTPVGGEEKQGDGVTREAVLSSASVYMNGQPIDITAYNIKDNNFFKLRDLCRILNIYIEWDPVWNMICVDTDRTYIDN